MRIHSIVLLFAVGCTPVPQTPRAYDAEHQVREAVDTTVDAARHGRSDVVLAMLDPQFVLIANGARVPRASITVSRLPVERRVIRVDHVTSSSAVVISKDEQDRRFAEVWVRRADGWKLERMEEVSLGG
jgi:hypothetical protein